MTTEMLRIRVPTPLKTALQEHAEENDRSMNAELVQILKAHFGVLKKRRIGRKVKDAA